MTMNNEGIALRIKKIREDNGLNQEQFASKLEVARPTISNWESGKIVPTTEQLIRIALTFNYSIDKLLGVNIVSEKWILPDTSALIKRPRFINELSRRFDRVIIAETVVSELNGLKDHNPRVKQQAWLAMTSISNEKNKDQSNVEVYSDSKNFDVNDDRIIDLATRLAKQNSNVAVYVLSNDVYFMNQTKRPGVTFLTLDDYDRMMSDDTSEYDLKSTLDFFNAVKSRDIKKAKSKYDSGNVDPNRTNVESGFTPLLQAIRNKDIHMVDYLLTLKDIDINKCDDKKYCLPPLSHAIQMDYLEMIDLLIASGCDVDRGSDGKNGGNTPLMIACWHGQTDTVAKLLECGACVNQQDTNGFTALIKCCIRNHPSCAKLLIDKTDLKIRCRKGKTAEDYARESKNPELQSLFAQRRYQ